MHRNSVSLLFVLNFFITPAYAETCSPALIKQMLVQLWTGKAPEGTAEELVLKDLFDELVERFPPGPTETAGMPSKKAMDELSNKILTRLNARKNRQSIKLGEEQNFEEAVRLLNVFATQGFVSDIEKIPGKSANDIIEMAQAIQTTYRRPSRYRIENDVVVKVDPQKGKPHVVEKAQLRRGQLSTDINAEIQALDASDVFKKALYDDLEKLNFRQRQFFLKSVLSNKQTPEEVMEFFRIESVKDFDETLRDVVNDLRVEIKNHHPDQLIELDDFLRKRVRSFSTPRTNVALGEIPDVRQVLSSAKFERFDPKFKEVLADEVLRLSPMQRQAFIRMVLKEEKPADLLKELRVDRTDMLRSRRQSAVFSLRERFRENHPDLLNQFDVVVGEKGFDPSVLEWARKQREISKSLSVVDSLQLSPNLKEALKNGLSRLSERQRDIVIRTFFKSESEIDVANALQITVQNVRATRNRSVGKLKKVLSSDLRNEFEDFLRVNGSVRKSSDIEIVEEVFQKPVQNRTAPPIIGENPDVQEVLSSPEFEKMDLEFAQILKNEILDLKPNQQQVFVRLILKNEKSSDVAKEIGMSPKDLQTKRMSAISALKERFRKKHPERLHEFNEFLEDQSQKPVIKNRQASLEQVTKALEGIDSNILKPELREALIGELSRLPDSRRNVFLRTVIQLEKDANIAASQNVKITSITAFRSFAIRDLREGFQKRNPSLLGQLDEFLNYESRQLGRKARAALTIENRAALESADPYVLKPELKDVLSEELADLMPLQRDIFYRSMINLEIDSDIAKSIDKPTTYVAQISSTGLRRLKDAMKLRHPELVDEFQAFVEHRMRQTGKQVRRGSVNGEIPDVKQVLSSPQFERMDPGFKEILTQEISELSPTSQQTFVRLVLLGEDPADLAKLMGAVRKGEISARRMNAIITLEKRFTEKHSDQLPALKAFLVAHGHRPRKVLSATGHIPDVNQVMSAPQFEKLEPQFKEALTKEVMTLPPQQQQAFIRTILQKESNVDMARDAGITAKDVQVRSHNSIGTLKRRFKDEHPEFVQKLEEFIDAQKKR